MSLFGFGSGHTSPARYRCRRGHVSETALTFTLALDGIAGIDQHVCIFCMRDWAIVEFGEMELVEEAAE